jgi:hypothetical protein
MPHGEGVEGRDLRAQVSPPETAGKILGILDIAEVFGANQPLQEVTSDAPENTMWLWHRHYITA